MLLSMAFATSTSSLISLTNSQEVPQSTQAPHIAHTGSITSDWTNLGPVTSLWTPPASCYLTTTSYDGSLYIYDHFTGSRISSISCNPPIPWLPAITSGVMALDGPATWTSRYYSPAICPSGWSTAVDLSPSWQTAAGDSANTAFLCCPTGFVAPTNTLDPCTSVLPSGATLSNVWSRPTASSQVLIGTSPVLGPQVLQTSQRIDAMPIVVLWQTTDAQILAVLASLSSTDLGTQTTSVTGVSAPHTSFSAGVKGGIAAGIVAVFLAIVLGLFCVFRKRGRKDDGHNDLIDSVRHMGSAQRDNTPNEYEMRRRPNTTEAIQDKKRETFVSTNTCETDGNWDFIPTFPAPPIPPIPLQQDTSTKHGTNWLDTNSQYSAEENTVRLSALLRNTDLPVLEHHFSRNERQDDVLPGERLAPKIYTPPGSAGLSRQSTMLGSSPPGSSMSSAGKMTPIPLFSSSANPEQQGRRPSLLLRSPQ